MRKRFKLVVDSQIVFIGNIKECCEKSYDYKDNYEIEIADMVDEYIYYCLINKLDLRKSESLERFRKYVAQNKEI